MIVKERIMKQRREFESVNMTLVNKD